VRTRPPLASQVGDERKHLLVVHTVTTAETWGRRF
jgi:hypothetical protein